MTYLRRMHLLLAAGALFGLMGPVLASTTATNGYVARRQLDTIDAGAVTVWPVRSFNAGEGSKLGVDSNGDVFIAAWTLDPAPPVYGYQELLRFTPTDTGPSNPTLLLTLRAYDAFIRTLLVVPAGTTDGAGNQLLQKDHLLLIVDGYDELADVSWREIWQIDPAAPGSHTVLYRKSPEPARYPGSVGGVLAASIDAGGTIYLQEEFDPNLVNPGSIRALRFDAAAATYVEDALGVTSDNQTTGKVIVGPDGFLYGFERTSPATDSPRTDRIVRIDPTATDSWTTYAPFSRKFGERHPTHIDLEFDSEGQLWMLAAVWEKGRTVEVLLRVDAGASVSAGNRMAEAPDFVHSQLATGPAGKIYVIEREIQGDNDNPPLDAIVELAPAEGGSGGGSGGGGNGNGKGKNR